MSLWNLNLYVTLLVQKGVVARSHTTTPLIHFKYNQDIDTDRGTLCIVSSKTSSGNFAFPSQTHSDKTFPKYMSRLPTCANLPCVCSYWGKSFSQLKLITSHNHAARRLMDLATCDESETSSHEGHCQSVCQKDQECKVKI